MSTQAFHCHEDDLRLCLLFVSRMLDDLETNVERTDTKLQSSLKRLQRFVRETEGNPA